MPALSRWLWRQLGAMASLPPANRVVRPAPIGSRWSSGLLADVVYTHPPIETPPRAAARWPNAPGRSPSLAVDTLLAWGHWADLMRGGLVGSSSGRVWLLLFRVSIYRSNEWTAKGTPGWPPNWRGCLAVWLSVLSLAKTRRETDTSSRAAATRLVRLILAPADRRWYMAGWLRRRGREHGPK